VPGTYWQALDMQVALGEVVVAVAQAGCRHLNDLAVLGFIKLDFLDNPFAWRLPQQRRSCLHWLATLSSRQLLLLSPKGRMWIRRDQPEES
jgi:hypothetical protein